MFRIAEIIKLFGTWSLSSRSLQLSRDIKSLMNNKQFKKVCGQCPELDLIGLGQLHINLEAVGWILSCMPVVSSQLATWLFSDKFYLFKMGNTMFCEYQMIRYMKKCFVTHFAAFQITVRISERVSLHLVERLD